MRMFPSSVGRHGDGIPSMEPWCPCLPLHSRAHARSLARCADRQAKQRSIRDWDLRFCFQSLRAALICGLIKVTQRCDNPHSTVRAPWNAELVQRYRGTSAGRPCRTGSWGLPCPPVHRRPRRWPRRACIFFFSCSPCHLILMRWATRRALLSLCLRASVPPRGCRRSSYRAAFLPTNSLPPPPSTRRPGVSLHVSISHSLSSHPQPSALSLSLPLLSLSTVYSTQSFVLLTGLLPPPPFHINIIITSTD